MSQECGLFGIQGFAVFLNFTSHMFSPCALILSISNKHDHAKSHSYHAKHTRHSDKKTWTL